MDSSLKSRTIGGLSWSMLQEAIQRLLQFGAGVVMARILMPEEFGLLAMLNVFIALAQTLQDGGFGAALIQRKDLSETEKSTVFYFNLFLSFSMACFVYVLAPYIAGFYGQTQLIKITRVLALVLVFNGLIGVQYALLVRALEFKRSMIVGVISTLASGVVGVAMAAFGYGIWSLVGQALTNSLMRVCLLWGGGSWRPKWLFKSATLNDLFTFGSGMMASNVLNTVFDNLNALLIGKYYPPDTVGYYSRAQSLQSIPAQNLGSVVVRVMFPVFSGLQNDLGRLRSGLKNGITTLAAVQFPTMLGLAAVAKPVVFVLLTEKWAACIPFLQLLCFAGLWYPIQCLNGSVLMAVGQSKLLFRMELYKKLLIILNILLTFRWGVVALLWGSVVTSAVSLLLHAHYTEKHAGYLAWDQIQDMLPYLGVSFVMGVVVAITPPPFRCGDGGLLVFKTLLGSLLYAVLCWWLRLPAFANLLSIARSRLASLCV